MKISTRESQSRETWLAERKTYIGGSDAASVLNAGRYGCSRKLFYDKLEHPKDFDDSERMEFRRGRRLEGIVAAYYKEKTGREVCVTTTQKVPGKPHLATNMDRLAFKADDAAKANPGYLELKVVGKFSFLKIAKEGLIDDYAIQVQQGCAVSGCSWGSYGIYCPEIDELLWWDVEADREFGELILERSDDWWNFHRECRVMPDPLPDGAKACESCPWSLTCRGSIVVPADAGKISRPDLEPWAAKFSEVKGMGSETEQAEEELKAEFMEAVKGVPGVYICGRFEVPFTITKQKRFSGELLKQKDAALYESLRVESEVKTIRKPKEV